MTKRQYRVIDDLNEKHWVSACVYVQILAAGFHGLAMPDGRTYYKLYQSEERDVL